jgi:hypothetical protein
VLGDRRRPTQPPLPKAARSKGPTCIRKALNEREGNQIKRGTRGSARTPITGDDVQRVTRGFRELAAWAEEAADVASTLTPEVLP